MEPELSQMNRPTFGRAWYKHRSLSVGYSGEIRTMSDEYAGYRPDIIG